MQKRIVYILYIYKFYFSIYETKFVFLVNIFVNSTWIKKAILNISKMYTCIYYLNVWSVYLELQFF